MRKESEARQSASAKFFTKRQRWILSVIFSLAVVHQANAIPIVSNLGDPWTSGGIGDIHALFPGGTPYGTDTAYFGTFAGSYYLNSITLELDGDAAPQWLNIQLFQQTFGGSTLIGSFGNPVADSQPTQWPHSSNPNGYTTFYDFSASGLIELNPFSEYLIVLSDPSNSPVAIPLLFTRSPVYTSTAEWTMSPTTSGDPYAAGENLVMAVNAVEVPDEAYTAVLLAGGFSLLMAFHRFVDKNRQLRKADFS